MMDEPNARRQRDARPIGALVGAAIEPVCARRGFATVDLIQAWADIVGPRYANATQPEKLTWPRRDTLKEEKANKASGATLVIRVDAGMAIYLQHETALILERVNGFLGFGAVSTIRLVQGPVHPAAPASSRPAQPLSAGAERAVASEISTVESDGLREALARLGRGVYGMVERS